MTSALGARLDKVTTITNGFDREDFAPFANMRRGDNPSTARPLRLAYVGTIAEGQVGGVASLFAALEALAREDRGTEQIQLQLVGSFGAAIHQRARPLVEQGMVEFLPFKPHHEAIACMMEADVLLLVRPDDLDGRIVHTSKLFEYMATGRPILAIAPHGEITLLIEEEHLGWSAAPGDVGGIAAALRSMLAQHQQGTLATNARDPQRLGRWERRALTGQLAALFDWLVEGKA
jgi:glycosyltransferase involved in cell wall biosynthesis